MADDDRSDNEDDLEYVERLTNSFAGKDATPESIALSKYRKILVIQNKIRDRKTQHQAEMRRMNTTINSLSKQIAKKKKMQARQKGKVDDPNPEEADDADECDEDNLYGEETIESLENELEAQLGERASATTLCEADVDAYMTDLPVLDPQEKIIVRGFVALEKEKKAATLRSMRRRSSKGMEAAKMKRFTNLQFAEFFSQRNGQQFDELLHDEMLTLIEHYKQADANESGAFEEDDFIKLVQRLMCDFGITIPEIDRVGILCDVSILDGFVFNLRQFYDLMFFLLPALSDAESRIRRSAEESLDGLRLRQGLAAKDEARKFEIEKLRQRKTLANSTVAETPEQAQCREERARQLKIMRMDWARSAVILTHHELERIRALKLKRSSVADPSGTGARKKSLPAAEGTLDDTAPEKKPQQQSIAASPASRQRVSPTRRKESDDDNKKAPSTSMARELDKFKCSVKTALERAPFPDVAAPDAAGSNKDRFDEHQLNQFRTLFNVLSDGQPTITASHIHQLLELFTPCGCDATEAELFLKDECHGLSGLHFEQFLEFGGRLRARCFAYSTFDGLPTERAKVQAIIERTGNLRRSKPLRRYERIFMRLHLAQEKQRRENGGETSPCHNQKRLPQPPGSSVAKPSAPRPSTAANKEPATKDAPLALQATPAEAQSSAARTSPNRRGNTARFASARSTKTEQRVPLPSARFPKSGFPRFDLHACRLAQDQQLVTDLRSMYLI